MSSATSHLRYRSWLTNILLVVVVVAGVQWWRARALASGAAPELVGTLIDGHTVAPHWSDESGNHRPVLVHFWATWCPVCRMEQGAIQALADNHRVVTVALQSGDAEDVRRFMGAQQIDFPVLPDPDGVIAQAWGVSAVPTTFVVDATGNIRFATTGISSEAGLRARLWIADKLH